MDIINNKKNKSTIFILPLLYPEIDYTNVLFEHFINCYISDVHAIDPENSLIIEFDDNSARFRVPIELLGDYKKIIRSQYSEITNESKQQIVYFWKENDDSYLHSVLHKTQKILDYWSKKTNMEIFPSKEKEYWPKFNTYEETRGLNTLYKMFNFNLIK